MKIYLTNATSRRPPHRGPGRVWTIMAAPRPQYGENGEGRCALLTPNLTWVQDVKAGRMSMEDYRTGYIDARADVMAFLEPGELVAIPDPVVRIGVTVGTVPVADGDTLLCCCSRKAAAEGNCHRVWAAELLKSAGWEVILDGKRLQ